MKGLVIKLGLIGLGLLLALAAIQGCTFNGSPFVATISPESGHPPFQVTITVTDMGGGTYTYQVAGQKAVESTEHVFKATVDRWPWEAKITWQDGNDIRTTTVKPTLVNVPPVIRKPRIGGAPGLWKAFPYMQTMIFFNHQKYSVYGKEIETGISDPDGDKWHVTNLVVKCDGKTKPDTLFYPSRYGIEKYHVGVGEGYSERDVYPAAIWYPTYTAEKKDDSGLPESLTPLAGYTVDADFVKKTWRWQSATITVTAEDEFGASSTRTFVIPVDPYKAKAGG